MNQELRSHPLPRFFGVLNPHAPPFKLRAKVPFFSEEQMLLAKHFMQKELEEIEELEKEEKAYLSPDGR